MEQGVTSMPFWSEEKLTHLQAQLTGTWAEDNWPLMYRNKKKQLVERSLHFSLVSSSLKVEFKYTLWYHLDRGMWKTPNSQETLYYRSHYLMEWLNETAPAARSLLEKSLEAWISSLRAWLLQKGHYSPSSEKKLGSSQTYNIHRKEDKRIYLFRVMYRTLADAYDDRPETEKDIWDLRKLGLTLNLSNSNTHLHFADILQPWLRELAKQYLIYNTALRSAADCTNKLCAIRQFSHFLAQTVPQTHVADLKRGLILRYLSFLQEKKIALGTRLNYITGLRAFLETCAPRLHIPGLTQEPLIFNDDLGQRPEYRSREIPEEVLVQLRQHLDTLPTTILRMVTILLELGLRINELCQLPLDCLVCDDKHEWYLRYYQTKTRREQVVPLVDESLVGAIQIQQQEIRTQWGNSCSYLFPSSTLSPGRPYHQSVFSKQLNTWALKHEIRDRNQQLYHFTSHQFRHTVGMRLINEDVPLEVVGRLLGPRSLRMTEVYARIRDKKLRADLERVARRRKTVDYQGNTVKGDRAANDPVAQILRKGVRGQTLPVGGCGRLIVLGECSYANKCLTCPMWLTSTDDLPALKSFYDRAVNLKQRAIEKGNQIVIEQQDHIIPALALRIKSLETTEMDGSLCVDDVLAQLRTDLSEAECGLEEAQAAGLVLAARHLERAITEMKMRIAALEVPDDRSHE